MGTSRPDRSAAVGLFMNAAIPRAFDDAAWGLVATFLLIHTGRAARLLTVDLDRVDQEHFIRVLIWFVVAAPPWQTGAAAGGGAPLAWWSKRRLGDWVTGNEEPHGAALAAWAAVYGTCYLAVAVVLLVFRPRYSGWEAVLATALLFALVLLLVTPRLVTRRVRRRIVTRLVDQATPSRYPDSDAVPEAFLTHLYGTGQLYRFLTVRTAGGSIELSKRGLRVAKRIQAKVPNYWPATF
ncbi:MAG: hypothetical protein ABIQ18_16865 [Umezawaea sp.]